jgi:rhomboid protease GluP
MSVERRPGSNLLAWSLGVLIVLTWLLAATLLQQSPLAVQRSNQLLDLGAINGALLNPSGSWRVVASQFLHSHFSHMLFNAITVVAVGAMIERVWGTLWLAVVYVIGGSIGQVASVVSYPDLVSSGASQALMALCGAALLMRKGRVGALLVVAVLMVQVALDLHAAHKIKAGHGWGFLAGLLIGTIAVLAFKKPEVSRHVAQQIVAAGREP